MTTFATVKATCGNCGAVSEQQVLSSTNSFGSPDLDLRPPEMQRSTMRMWLQICPSEQIEAKDRACHTVADALGE